MCSVTEMPNPQSAKHWHLKLHLTDKFVKPKLQLKVQNDWKLSQNGVLIYNFSSELCAILLKNAREIPTQCSFAAPYISTTHGANHRE